MRFEDDDIGYEDEFDPDRDILVSAYDPDERKVEYKYESNLPEASYAYIIICGVLIGLIVVAFAAFGSGIGAGSSFIAIGFIVAFCFFYWGLSSSVKSISSQAENLNAVSRRMRYERTARTNARKKVKKNHGMEPIKKFDSYKDYENSAEYQIDEAVVAQKMRDDIDLAIEALGRLGYGKRKAADWVNRAVSSGIDTGNTQGIIKFVLTKGAVR